VSLLGGRLDHERPPTAAGADQADVHFFVSAEDAVVAGGGDGHRRRGRGEERASGEGHREVSVGAKGGNEVMLPGDAGGGKEEIGEGYIECRQYFLRPRDLGHAGRILERLGRHPNKVRSRDRYHRGRSCRNLDRCRLQMGNWFCRNFGFWRDRLARISSTPATSSGRNRKSAGSQSRC